MRKGRELPDWFHDCPEIEPYDAFYLNSFWDLATCRQIALEPTDIPWTAINEYADYRGLTGYVKDFFIRMIRVVDKEYLKYLEENKPEASKTTPESKTKPMPRRAMRRLK